MNNDRDTFWELRKSFDGNDPFMTQGHQILKIRRGDRRIPTWAKDKRKIQAILLRSFPGLRTNIQQRARAARWVVIIQLYFRVQMTLTQVAEETKLPKSLVQSLIRSISRAAAGRKANSQGAFVRGSAGLAGQRPPGRPKKQVP